MDEGTATMILNGRKFSNETKIRLLCYILLAFVH